MNNVVINFKTDKETKEKLQAFSAKIGIPVSSILNAQIRKTLLDQRLTLSTEPTINDGTLNEIIESVADYKAHKNISKTINNGQELRNYLENL